MLESENPSESRAGVRDLAGESHRVTASTAPGDPWQSSRQQLGELKGHDADDRIHQRLLQNRRIWGTEVRRPSTTYNPMKISACSAAAAKNTTNRAGTCVTMNCVPITPARKPTTVFRQAANAHNATRHRILDEACEGPRQQTRHRP